MDARKGSNALVATVDFYSAAIADLQGMLDQQTKMINAIGEQIRERDRVIENNSRLLSEQVKRTQEERENVERLATAARLLIDAVAGIDELDAEHPKGVFSPRQRKHRAACVREMRQALEKAGCRDPLG